MSSENRLDLSEVLIDPSCAMKVPAAFALQRNILPLCWIAGDLAVAMSNPSDVQSIALLRRALGVPVIAWAADENAIQAILRRLYGGVNSLQGDVVREDAVSMVDYLIRSAFMRHASDIHFDPDREGIRVRFRVDGELDEIMRVPPALQPSVTSRLKVMANLKLDERRAPQDGAFSWDVPKAFSDVAASLDVRLATLPGRYGERVTLRLLETGLKNYSLGQIGLLDDDRVKFEGVLASPHGLTLLTGPTGSGKSTTLYAAIQYLQKLRPLNIITVENPIEYEIPGIFQAEVDIGDKVNFSKALRSILRHDPDVIMIGEIRDFESLDTAVKAALTGHLVLSTLHTNNAVNTVTRLTNMGLERHLSAATLRLSIAQRLVRSLCPHCCEPYAVSAEEAATFGMPDLEGRTVWRPRGCVYCAGRGMRGRVGLFEFFKPDSEISSAIASGVPEGELVRLSRIHGERSLVEDGIAKCLNGLTTLDEVYRVAGVF